MKARFWHEQHMKVDEIKEIQTLVIRNESRNGWAEKNIQQNVKRKTQRNRTPRTIQFISNKFGLNKPLLQLERGIVSHH